MGTVVETLKVMKYFVIALCKKKLRDEVGEEVKNLWMTSTNATAS